MDKTKRKHVASMTLFLILFISVFARAQNEDKIIGDVFTVSWKISAGKNINTVEIIVTPIGDVHCNLEYPWKLTVKDAVATRFKKEVFGRAEASVFSADTVVFKLPFSKEKGNNGHALLELKLSMCDDSQCFMKKVPIDLKIP